MSVVIPKTENRVPVYNVVLDIDHVLATCDSIQTPEEALFFRQRGAIVTAIKTHYVFPGVLEMIKGLYAMEDVRTSFYSAGSQERNRVFVDQLLERALPTEVSSRAKKEVCILSREDLNESWQKDISRVLRNGHTGDSVDNTVLVDDRLLNVVPEQSPNFLFVPPSTVGTFAALRRKKDFYEETGFKFLKCGITPESFADYASIRKPVDEGKCIFAARKDADTFDLRFLDGRSELYRIEPISAETHQPLASALERIYQENLKKDCVVTPVNDPEVHKNLCGLVDSIGGKTQTICHRANRIYYVAGLLWTALAEAKSQQIPLAHALFPLQSERIRMGGIDVYMQKFKESPRQDLYYHRGLDILRKINGDLELINPHNYEKTIQAGIPPEEVAQLQKLIQDRWE